MAEEEGFEPPRAVTPLSVFETDPFSQTWVLLHFVDGAYRTPTCGAGALLAELETPSRNDREDRI
jgi:hypothetical protein